MQIKEKFNEAFNALSDDQKKVRTCHHVHPPTLTTTLLHLHW